MDFREEQRISALVRSRAEAWRFQRHIGVPRFLYKFQGPGSASVSGIIERSEIWLASPASFNDPFEFAARIYFGGTTVDRRRHFLRMAKQNGMPKKVREEVASNWIAEGAFERLSSVAFRDRVSEFGVACFASRLHPQAPGLGPRDVLMWSHYADSHKGICFQFHTPRSHDVFFEALQVTYSTDYISVDWANEESIKNNLRKVLVQKSAPWVYEAEYRIALIGRANSVHQFRPKALTGIILGCKVTPESEDAIVSSCVRRRLAGMPPVKIYRAKMSQTAYKLVISRASDLEGRCAAD